jgi:hypothetical protein
LKIPLKAQDGSIGNSYYSIIKNVDADTHLPKGKTGDDMFPTAIPIPL